MKLWSFQVHRISFLCRQIGNQGFLLEPISTIHYTNIESSANLNSLVFTSYNSAFYGFTTQTIHYTPETIAHRKIRYRRKSGMSGPMKSPTPPTPPGTAKSPTKLIPMSPTKVTASCVLYYFRPLCLLLLHHICNKICNTPTCCLLNLRDKVVIWVLSRP